MENATDILIERDIQDARISISLLKKYVSLIKVLYVFQLEMKVKTLSQCTVNLMKFLRMI